MYYHACLKISALLILYYMVSCSASKLEYFEDAFTQEYALLDFSGVFGVGGIYQGSLDRAVTECSEECYRTKYFCDLFMIIDEPNTGRICYMYNTLASSFSSSQVQQGRATRAVFKLSERKDIEPLERRFSYDHKTSLDEWITKLDNGYSLFSSRVPQEVLFGSLKAMNSKPATAIDFDKWVITKDVSNSWRMPFELHKFSGWKIMEAVKEWEQFTNGNKQASTEYFDTLLLTFLDIFCPCLQPGITTVYDPVKKVVLITKEDLQILVISYGPGEFAIVQSKNNFYSPEVDVLVSMSNSDHWLERNIPVTPMELFQRATSKRSSHPAYDSIPTSSENERVATLLNVLNSVIFSLSPNLFPWVLTGPSYVFYRDLITVVLSSVYKNYEGHPVFTNLKNSMMKKYYDDISISTLH